MSCNNDSVWHDCRNDSNSSRISGLLIGTVPIFAYISDKKK
jgi:hypothetical protein